MSMEVRALMEKKQVGVVKFYHPRKRYGFITCEGGKDVFFHLNHVRSLSPPVPGHAVQFVEGRNAEGPTAEDIIIVPDSYIAYEQGVIEQLTFEGGVIACDHHRRPVNFLAKDFIPRERVNSLVEGVEVEMALLVEEPDGVRATVVRPLGFNPNAQARSERPASEEEEDNRRLLGILYKTDHDEEAAEAASILCERNLRATLSALVERIFDPRLQRRTRVHLVRLIPRIYLDDESQPFLHLTAHSLADLLEAEEPDPSKVRQMMDHLFVSTTWPYRWSQYLLPYGLTVLRHLATYDPFPMIFKDDSLSGRVLYWLDRACAHVEQRRSGFSYVLATALAALDALWHLNLLPTRIEELSARLIHAAEGEELGQQLHFLRERLSASYGALLLEPLSQHAEVELILRDTGATETLVGWIEALGREADGRGENPCESLLRILPSLETLAQSERLRGPLEGALKPFWDRMTPDYLASLLHHGQLSDGALWPCLRHWDQHGAWSAWLAHEALRQELLEWLQRVCAHGTASLPPRWGTNLALRLIEELQAYADLRPALRGILGLLFSDVCERLETAPANTLTELLEQVADLPLPGLAGVLVRRLTDGSLEEMARRRIVGFFQRLGPPLDEWSELVEQWQQRPTDPRVISELCEAARQSDDPRPEVREFGKALQARLAEEEIVVHDGFITHLEPGPKGEECCRIEGYDIRLPRRLFQDPRDFAVNQYVRLVQRGGLAMGVVRVAVPESEYVCGLLAQPLEVNERGVIHGVITDGHNQTYAFALTHVVRGSRCALRVGDLLKFTRAPAPPGSATDFLAFNLATEFGPEDLPLLLGTYEQATLEPVRAQALRTLLDLLPAPEETSGEVRASWTARMRQMNAEAWQRFLDSLTVEERARVEAWLK